MGKGVDLQRCGQIQDAGRLSSRLHLGIDDHGKAQLLPEIAHLPAVVGGAHTSDGGAVCHLLTHRAAQKVEFVRLGDGDQQVGSFDAGLLEHTIAGAVALDAHNIIKVCQRLCLLSVPVHDGNIVPFLTQLFHQRAAHLAAAHDDDPQTAFFFFFLSKHCSRLHLMSEKQRYLSIFHYNTLFMKIKVLHL